jgi:zona occludens toxin (predicted ATPase)
MHIFIEEFDGAFYADILITPKDLARISEMEMVNAETIYKHRKYHVGVAVEKKEDYDYDDID